MSLHEDCFKVTGCGLLAEAEEEAREKYFAFAPDRWLSQRQGVGRVDLGDVSVFADTLNGQEFKYFWVRTDYATGGNFEGREAAVAAVQRVLDGCLCGILRNVLCPVCGDERDTSVDFVRLQEVGL